MVYAILLVAMLFTVIGAVRLRNATLRPSPAYSAVQRGIGAAVEDNRGLHISLGASAPRQATTITALAGAEFAYQAVLRAALADQPVRVTLSDPIGLTLAQDRLRRAYRLRSAPERYRNTLARWYPQGAYSLAFAAGVGAAILTDDFSTNLLAGHFGPEMILIAESAMRNDRTLVPHSDTLEGQAVAYATSETPLFGEEIYVAPAYLDRTPLHIGGVVAQDALRLAVVGVIVLFGLLTFLGIAY